MTIVMYSGVIADTPSGPTSLIRVSVPNLQAMNRVVYGPMKFRYNTSSTGTPLTPAIGDKAIVAVDSEGGPWIVCWGS